VVDFGVERHTLVTGEITQVFHQSSTTVLQDSAAGAHLFRERAQLLRRFSGSTCPIQGEFRDSPPTQLRGRPGCIFFLVSRQIPTEESSGVHFPDIGSATLGEDTFGVPERSSDQIQGNPSDPFHSRPGRSV
jgi:hypothetical protein